MGITNPDYMHIKSVLRGCGVTLATYFVKKTNKQTNKTIIQSSNLKTYLNCCEFLASLR